ncbi:MAG: hypothetical protein COX81_01480 [Candidatus Magasanikbacteria bacterium CG_4_10_14_0_2_um_filter_37_12]|uniref:Capsular polysaccharide assembling protein CapF C-terminal domain-containing protein n=1 Tax=Candidatus Magasanikbacteria bacterium CG_4_10_14_0_2_um_filter_37_12 TaxID=1974637 RepID=A0A2M7V8S1_9BACT|nr:MAG: hypothetical protein COX81_01480 [Candidatus Magasanikbacteria bacterium CG_4_10_14_0_2_um_filter_37_12]
MMGSEDFIEHFKMEEDNSKPGRTLWSVKVGDVYMSRLIIDPGVTTGEYYHKVNKVMLYLESGSVLLKVENVITKERTKINLQPCKDVIHIPTFVAHPTTNIGKEPAVLVFFSNYPLRKDDDCYNYNVE